MALIQNMTRLEQRLSRLHDRFGDPRLVRVVLELGDIQHVLDPKPNLAAINPDRIGKYLGSNVEIQGDEEVLSPLFRTLPEEFYSNAKYLLDATWDGLKWTGQRADLIYLDRNNTRYYKAYVIRQRGR